jgi:thioredoxin 1
MNKKLMLFSASWCAPCKALKQHAESKDIEFDVVYDVDTPEGQEYSRLNGVRGVPTLILFGDGEEMERMIGFDLTKFYEMTKGI